MEMVVGTYTQTACLSSNKVSTFAPIEVRRLLEGCCVQLFPDLLKRIHTSPFFGDLKVALKLVCICVVTFCEGIDSLYTR